MTVINKHVSKLFAENVTQPILLNKINVEPSSARWLYWSQMKDNSFCFGKKLQVKNKNNLAFHPGQVEPPSGEGHPLPELHRL